MKFARFVVMNTFNRKRFNFRTAVCVCRLHVRIGQIIKLVYAPKGNNAAPFDHRNIKKIELSTISLASVRHLITHLVGIQTLKVLRYLNSNDEINK